MMFVEAKRSFKKSKSYLLNIIKEPGIYLIIIHFVKGMMQLNGQDQIQLMSLSI